MSDSGKRRQREQVKAWFAARPGYLREWRKRGSLAIPAPVHKRGRLPYSVNIAKPLTEEEYIAQGRRRRRGGAPMSISRATVDQAVQEIQRTQEQAEKQFKEDQITKVGKDPSQPYHPILNATEEELIERWRKARQATTRKKYGTVWNDCIEKIRSRTWTTRREIAKHYQRSNSWATCLVQLMEHQQVFTAEELRRLLPGNLKTTTRQPDNNSTKKRNKYHGSNLQSS